MLSVKINGPESLAALPELACSSMKYPGIPLIRISAIIPCHHSLPDFYVSEHPRPAIKRFLRILADLNQYHFPFSCKSRLQIPILSIDLASITAVSCYETCFVVPSFSPHWNFMCPTNTDRDSLVPCPRQFVNPLHAITSDTRLERGRHRS